MKQISYGWLLHKKIDLQTKNDNSNEEKDSLLDSQSFILAPQPSYSKKDGEINYHFELNKIDKDGLKTVSFKSPDKSIGSLTLLKSENRISCVVFYGKKMNITIMVFAFLI